ncbi:hypothetical protein MMC13_001145 [Lambiella insularis]|nr:hypothetical protein [Lambiella insularis]
MDPYWLFEGGHDISSAEWDGQSISHTSTETSSRAPSTALDPNGDYNLGTLQHWFIPLVGLMHRAGYNEQQAVEAIDFPDFWDKPPVSVEFRAWAMEVISDADFSPASEGSAYGQTISSPVFSGFLPALEDQNTHVHPHNALVFSEARFCETPDSYSHTSFDETVHEEHERELSYHAPRFSLVSTPKLDVENLEDETSYHPSGFSLVSTPELEIAFRRWKNWWLGCFPDFHDRDLTFQQVIDTINYPPSGFDLWTMPRNFRTWAMEAAWQQGFRTTITPTSTSPSATEDDIQLIVLQDWFVNWIPAIRAGVHNVEDAVEWIDLLPCRGLPDKTPEFRAWARQAIELVVNKSLQVW